MAISTRELYIIFRARDEASRVVRAFAQNIDKNNTAMVESHKKAMKKLQKGSALIGVGTGMAAAGAAVIQFYADATKAAIEYNQAAAKTLTQVDTIGGSLERIKDIGIAVASVVPVPFEQTQGALYDIFSSMEVTIDDAEHLLTEFSKAAVAGQVDLQDASRATIGILNAYKLPAEEVNRVNDTMFQLVRKGVGTYGQFATTIGRAVPSAVRAGQSIEDLSGMLAFLTRNGLSAAMASASAGRALDALSNPKTVDRLSEFGETAHKALGPEVAEKLGITKDAMIKVTDAAGKFRPVSAIMTDLGKSMKKLNARQIAAVMQELLKGSGGTIQARRFFDVAIRNFDELNNLTGDMHKSAGALKGAYDIMFKQPQTQLQRLNNLFQIFKVQIGDALIPIVMKLVSWGVKLLNWFNKLPSGVKQGIAIVGAFTAVVITLIGLITALAGAFLVLSAASTLLGVALAPIAITIGLIIAAVIALGIIVFLIVKYHKEIWAFIQMIWHTVVDFLIMVWDSIYQKASEWVQAIWEVIVSIFNAIVDFLKMIWNSAIVQLFVTAFTTLFTIWKEFWLTMLTIAKVSALILWEAIKKVLKLLSDAFIFAWGVIKGATQAAWNLIKRYIIEPMGAVLSALNRTVLGPIKRVISDAWEVIKTATLMAWDKVKQYIIDPITAAYQAVVNFINLIVEKLTWLKDQAESIGKKIRDFLNAINPASLFSPSLVQQTKWGFDDLKKVVGSGLRSIDMMTHDRSFEIRGTLTDIARNTQAIGMAPVGFARGERPIHQQINVTTNEIDPARHAALLGLELGRR